MCSLEIVMNLCVTPRESLCLCCRVDVRDKAASSSYLSPSATHQSDVGQPSVPPQLPLHKIANSTNSTSCTWILQWHFLGSRSRPGRTCRCWRAPGRWRHPTHGDPLPAPPCCCVPARPCTAPHCGTRQGLTYQLRSLAGYLSRPGPCRAYLIQRKTT